MNKSFARPLAKDIGIAYAVINITTASFFVKQKSTVKQQ